MIKNIKEKFIEAGGSVSGIASVLGSWQVCHNVCLGIVAVLALLGIAVVGMPLAFLTKLAIPFWTIAFVLLLITILLYFKKRCISNRLILFNSGLIIAGIPFQTLEIFNPIFWTVGASFLLGATSLYIKDKISMRKNHECRK